MSKRLLVWPLRLLFYLCLDAVTGTIIYAISVGEADLTPGQLAIRILTAMALASAIVGGPDIMMFWQELGRRMAAERERDNAQAKVAEQGQEISEHTQKISELGREVSERDQKIAERDQVIAEMRTLIADLQEQNRRPARRARRRPLRDNGQA